MKRISILFVIIALVVGGWSAAWLFAANQISTAVATPSTPTASGGVAPIGCDDFSVGGWPFRFDLTCTGARFVDGDMQFQVDEIKATVLVYRPTHAIVFAKGPLRYSDAFYGTEQQVRWNKLEASVRLSGWSLARASLHIDKPQFVDLLMGENLLASADMLEVHLIDRPGETKENRTNIAIAAHAEMVSAPTLTIQNGTLTLDAAATHLISDVRLWTEPGILADWQAAGGKLEIASLTATDSDSEINLKGTLGLDAAGAPEGDMTLASKGVVERLEPLVNPQLLTTLFGGADSDNIRHQVLTIRRGAVLAGIIPLVVLPALF